MNRRWLLSAGTAAIAFWCAVALRAQYPGHIETQQKQAVTTSLRSIAVLEWTGDRSKPNATRLVPVSLFDGEHLQDGGLYLARPVPLALDSGTEYEVETSGLPQGWFEIDGARQIGDDWFGFGNWKPYVPPPPKPLHPSRNPPTVVRDRTPDDDKPHFVRRDQETGSGGAAKPDATKPDATKSGTANQSKTQASSEPVDPDRPRLRRRTDDSTTPRQTAGAPETPSIAPDPDRPKLSYGKPAELKEEPKPLELTPVALGQTVAVSDADSVSSLSFAFDWGSPADAANARKELEAQAVTLLASPASTPAPSAAKSAASATTSKPTRTPARTTPRKRTPHKAIATVSPFTDVHFSAFALTYGGGATLVLTAREAATTRSIAVIAIQDIYGKVQVLWHSVTDDTHLDVTPRMTLVDAVDPRGDGRANLLFEQRNATDRRFVLYAVGANTAEPVFATDPLPLHPVAQRGQ